MSAVAAGSKRRNVPNAHGQQHSEVLEGRGREGKSKMGEKRKQKDDMGKGRGAEGRRGPSQSKFLDMLLQ